MLLVFSSEMEQVRFWWRQLKGGKMILYFVSNPDSPYYQSAAFGKIIDYMAKYPRVCNLREQNGRRSMIVKDITDVDSAVRILQEIVSLG